MSGPKPAGAPPALSPARDRVLRAVADASGPVTLAMLAAVLGGHANTTRQQLDALVGQGLLASRAAPKVGRGRPPKAFALTDLGRRALGTRPEHAELVAAFTTHLLSGARPVEEARAVGRIWGAGRADATDGFEPGSGEPLAAVMDVLEALGFEPEQVTTDMGESAMVLRACPFLDLAEEHPDVVCELHRGLVDGVLQRLGAHGGVALMPFSEPDGCLLRLNS